MITVPAINGYPVFIPNSITNGSSSDGEYFYFFESNEEFRNFHDALTTQVIVEEKDIIDQFSDEQILKFKNRMQSL